MGRTIKFAAYAVIIAAAFYVLPQGKAIRYGVTVGEEALAWSGVARVGRKTQWPDWIPTREIQARLGPYPPCVAGGLANPLGRRIESWRTEGRAVARPGPVR